MVSIRSTVLVAALFVAAQAFAADPQPTAAPVAAPAAVAADAATPAMPAVEAAAPAADATTPAAADATAVAVDAPAPVVTPAPRVGIVMTAVPQIEVEIMGAGCLLCYATASAANSSLSKHSKTLAAEDIPQLKEIVAESLRQSGREVVIIPDVLEVKKLKKMKVKKGSQTVPRDFTGFKESHGLDELVVIEVGALGFHRTYSAYVPTSDPKALVRLALYQVKLADNTYAWQEPIEVLRSTESKWDEPPTFPGLTNAYYQAIENAKDLVLAKFKP